MELERDFVTWLDRRDAQALARVFDATGGKLLLLATHFGGAGQGAQDLVQATFLAAMAHGASWDRARPLWPWLAAILHNEARMQARRGRRRREVALDDIGEGHAVVAGAQGPQELAASEEMLAVVLRALDALPLPYRQVLRLRLVHGLRPIDIARSLEVPVGTVRAQLHRGLEQLRGSLPVGVAGVVAALLAGDEALLAQVRENVLKHALGGEVVTAGAIGAARVAVAGGFWSLHGKTVAMALAACAVLVCLGAAFGMPAWPWTSPADASPATLVHAELPVAAANPQTPTPEPDRHAAVVTDEPAWPLVVTVRTPDGVPIADANVTVWASPNGGVYWNRDSSVFLREDIDAGVTGTDGLFRSSLDGLRGRSSLVHRTTTVWVEASWPHDRPRQEIMLLPRTRDRQPITTTIELARRRVITGRVVDDGGNAVVGANVGPVRRDHIGTDVATRADGSFFLDCDDEADRWPERVAVIDPACGSAIVAVPPRDDTQRGVDLGSIALARGHTVRGRVVLGDSSPLAGLQLGLAAVDPSLGNDLVAIHKWLMREGSRNGYSRTVRDGRVVVSATQTSSLADGSFCFAGLEPDGVFLLSPTAVGALVERVVRPGRDSIELRIDQQVVRIDVIGEHGEPIPGAHVRLDGFDPVGKNPSYRNRPGYPDVGQVCGNWVPMADPEGHRFVLSPFGFVWFATVFDDAAQPTFVRHEALPGVHRATCRLELRPQSSFGKLHINAFDEHGQPIHFGARLKSKERAQELSCRGYVMPPEGWTVEMPAGQWQMEVALGKEMTWQQSEGGYMRGLQEQVVTIEDGRTMEVKVVAQPAGLVAFRVFTASPPKSEWLRVSVEAGGKPVDVWSHDRKLRPSDRGDLDPGELRVMFVTKHALPPGKHTFLVQADGYQPATCHVDVVADALTHVRVEMQPMPK